MRKQGKEERYDPCMQDAQHPQPLSMLSIIKAPFNRNLGRERVKVNLKEVPEVHSKQRKQINEENDKTKQIPDSILETFTQS